MSDIKAIPTIYRGVRFRSQLEAKWAFWLDQSRIRWEYEPTLFDLGGGIRYLPDFFLPDSDLWLEIKYKGFRKFHKSMRFAISGGNIMVFCGQPADCEIFARSGESSLCLIQCARLGECDCGNVAITIHYDDDGMPPGGMLDQHLNVVGASGQECDPSYDAESFKSVARKVLAKRLRFQAAK